MESIEVDGTSNRVSSHVWKDDPVSIPEEGQWVLPDNGIQAIAGGPK